MLDKSEWYLNAYFYIRLRLTSSARCAVFAFSFTPSASIFDGALFARLISGNNDDDCAWPGCTLFFPLPMLIGILAPARDGDGFRTIAPPGTSACLSLKNIGSFTCNSADCCTTTFGKLWDRFKCWDYIWYTYTRARTQIEKKNTIVRKRKTNTLTYFMHTPKCHPKIFVNLLTVCCCSALLNDLIFVIWWWPAIDAVLVCDGKFTPDDNGTETTKLPTDDDGCNDGSEWISKLLFKKCSLQSWTTSNSSNLFYRHTIALFYNVWCRVVCCFRYRIVCVSTFLL